MLEITSFFKVSYVWLSTVPIFLPTGQKGDGVPCILIIFSMAAGSTAWQIRYSEISESGTARVAPPVPDFTSMIPVLEHRGAFLNTGDDTLTYKGEKIPLTKNEYRILITLLENKGKIVSREKLTQKLWETDSFVDENTLTVNVGRLRKKLDSAGLADFIVTKFGRGYIVE